MPYALRGNTVVHADTGQPVPGGVHPNRKKALAHLRALEVNVMSHEKAASYKSYGREAMEFVAPVTTKVIRTGDTELGRHSEPAGSPLRLRAGSGKYLGLVGKRRKLVRKVRRLRGLHSFSHPPEISIKTYSPTQARDDHGRWAAVGSALHKLGKVRLRTKLHNAPSAIGHALAKPLSPAARGLVHLGARAVQHKLSPPSVLDVIDNALGHILSLQRARRGVRTKAGFSPTELRDSHGRWSTGGLGLLGTSTKHVRKVANELYGLKRQPPQVSLHTRYGISIDGESINGFYSPSKHEIHIATSGENPGLTTSHEFGHAFDHRGFSQHWLTSSAEGRAWRKAVNNTPEVKQWRKWQKQGYIERNGNRYHVSPDVFKYFLSNRELWARSFAQWHGTRSKNSRLKYELRTAQQNGLHTQWSNNNFSPVNAEIDRIMRKNGYI